MMKKLCVLLALVIMTGCAAVAQTAATPIWMNGDYTYIILQDGTAQIVAWEGEDAVLSVPAELDGFVVSSISECAFSDCVNLVSVTLPNTVVEIGEGAFMDCESLENVTLQEGLQRIGDLAFSGCEVLTRVALPDSVNAVGVNPFRGCDNLYDIFVSPNSAYLSTIDGVLFSKPDKRLISYPMGLLAGRYTVPEGVQIIGDMAFDRDLFLEEVVLPDSLQTIGQEAFYGCEGLRAMNIPAGVTSIGTEAMVCSNLVVTYESESAAPQFVDAGQRAGSEA